MNWTDFLPAAKSIVSGCRAQAPEGFDPQNTSIALIALGVAAVGAAVGSSYASSGSKAGVPDYPKIDLDLLQKLGIAGNQANLGAAQKLASSVNAGNRAEVLKEREAAVPGAIGQIQKNIGNQLAGVADVEDTSAAISNAQAANFNLGVGGASQFSKFAVVGKLGRSVAQQKQQGLQNFLNFVPALEAPRFDPASMFLSPALRVQNAQIEAKNAFDIAVARAAIKAQPSKGMKALGAGLGVVSNLASMGFGAALGGGGGMGGGGGNPQGGYSTGWGPTALTGSMGTTAPAGGSYNFPGQSASYGGPTKSWWQ